MTAAITLQRACEEKHAEQGALGKLLLEIATLVTAIWVGTMTDFFIGLGVYLVINHCALQVYNYSRNSDYKDAATDLGLPGFQSFIAERRNDLSIANILNIYRQYRDSLTLFNES